MKQYIVYGVVFLLVVLAGWVVLRDYHPNTEVNSQGTQRSTDNVSNNATQNIKMDTQPHMYTEDVGTSTEGRLITAYHFGTGTRELLFVGGMHGGYEWNSVMLAYTFIDYFSKHPEAVPAGSSLTIIPVLNPDGLFRVTGKQGRFSYDDVSTDQAVLASGRFNANNVDLNRNFGCKWSREGVWKGEKVNTGTRAFSEKESMVLKQYVETHTPALVVFWHSQAGAVYASECENGILPDTSVAMRTYADASGYRAIPSFDAYEVHGDSEGWLASIGIPAITVELTTHTTLDWEKNLEGMKALLAQYEARGEM